MPLYCSSIVKIKSLPTTDINYTVKSSTVHLSFLISFESIFNIEEYLYYNKNNIKKFNEYHQKTGISFTRLINSAIKESFENI